MDKNIVIDGVEYKINLEKAIKDGYLQKNEDFIFVAETFADI